MSPRMPKATPKPCAQCGGAFRPRWRAGKLNPYCSARCAGIARRGATGPRAERVALTCQGPGCGRTFEVTVSKTLGRRTCSRACADALKRIEQPGRRRGRLNPNYRHGRRIDEHVRADRPLFRDDDAWGCRHPRCEGSEPGFDQHHVVYRQAVTRAKGDPWDPRDALMLCKACHTSHHRRGTRIVPLSALRDENYEYARETLGAGPAFEYLRRRYSGTDPRLDALID